MKDDIRLQKEVIDELSWEPSLKAARIGVTVNNGCVTLLGMVDHYHEKRKTEKAAERIAGVNKIFNQLKVGRFPEHKITDAEIHSCIKETLKWHSAVEHDNIHFDVEKGLVTLSGEVEWKYQRTVIERAVSNLIGVESVCNQIMILPNIPPSNLKRKIQTAMERTAGLDAKTVIVTTKANKVLLEGKVSSLAQREAAEDVAWAGLGVRSVENKLDVGGPVNDF